MLNKMLLLSRPRRTALRKLPFLPRLGITLDVGGWQLTYKQTPLLEVLLNLRGRELSTKALRRVWGEALDEIRFPAGSPANLATVEKLRPRAAESKALKKPTAAKAASKRRPHSDTLS